MILLHYTTDDKTPYCGWHLAHTGVPVLLSKRLSLELAEALGAHLCDFCLYTKWRVEDRNDVLSHMPKCTVGITLWPDDESIQLCCDIPLLLHKDIPEDEQVHWDFSMGYWLGLDVDTVVFE